MGTGGAIEVLGPMAIDGDGSVGPRDRVVLGVLVLHHGDAVDTDVFADALWGDEPPASANKIVQGCVARLRKALGTGAIETVSHGYRFAAASDRVDAGRFERLTARSRELLSLGEAERAAHTAAEALDLWRGRPFPDLDDWEPGRAEITRLDELRLDVEELRIEAELRSGHPREVMAEAQRLVGSAPFREQRWALLATAQYQAGRQRDALATIRQARRLLAEELGLDPGPDLVALEDAILQQDPSLAPVVAEPEPSTTCPYRGLVPYGVADSDLFFGRDDDLGECLRRLADTGVVVVVGPSGSGKSSLVRAGIGASLEREGEPVVVITPGVHPMDTPAGAPSAGRAPVLVVDQCEEVATVCRDASERAQFLDTLVEHTGRGRLVVALRADRLGEVSSHAPFARLVERGLYLLQPMDEAHLRAAIEGPAHQGGLRLEPGLVDLLVRDVEGEPGALPLLSHALRQTWERREGRTLTVEGYQASGGIRGAVAQTAEAVFEAADPEQRAMLRDLMLRLVTPSPEGEPVRSRVPRRMVATDAEHEALVERLVVARLVTSDEDSVELAHEALARAWPRLREWLDDDVEGQRILRHLAASADAWVAMGRPDSELYRGARLARVVEWRDQNHPDLNADEVEFVDASVRREEREAQARRRRQRRTVTVVGAAAVLALVLAAVALIARNEAAEQRAEASQQEDTAEARRLMASSAAVLDADPELALLLATEAAERLPGDVEAETALHAATVASRTLLALTWPDERIFSTVPDLTEDGSTLAWVGGPGAVVEVRDVDSGALRWRYEFPTSNPADLHMAPQFIRGDRELMVTVQYSPQDPGTATDPPDVAGVHVFDVETGELVRTLPSSECGAWLGAGGNWSAVVSSNSDDYALWYQYSPTTISEHGCVPLGRGVSLPIDVVRVDVETGEHRPVVSDHVVNLHLHTAVSGDGRVVSVAAPGARSRVIDVESGEVVVELPEVSTTLGPTALSPDGSLVAFVAEQNHRLAIYDVATGARVSTIAGHRPTSQISNASFSADGTRLHTGGADGTARVWSVDTGEQLDVIGGLSAGVNETRMSGDGTRLAMSMFGREVRVVDLTPGGQPEVAVVDECGDGSAAGRVRNGGGLDVRPGRILSVLSCGGDATPGRAFVTDATTGDVTATVPALGESVAWSDDGTLLVTQEWRREGDVVVGGRLTVWDAGTGEAIATLDGLCEAEWTHRLSDVDRSIAFSSTPAQACRPAPDPPFAAANYRMRISPDDAHVAAIVDTGTNGFIVLADTEGAGDVHVLDGGVMTFARGGSELIVVRGPEGQMIAYDSESATPIREGPSIGRPIVDVQYVPDRDELITVGSPNISDSDIIRIDAESLEQVGVIEDTHDSPVSDLHLSPDLGVLATGGIDGHAKVWDMDSGQLLHDVSVADEPVVAVAVSEDGGTLYTATESGPVLGWVLDSGELLDIARSRSERGFSVAECVLYFPDEDCPVYEAADRGAASG